MSEKSDKWQSFQDKINAAIEEWRQEHPEATLTEIEEAVDSRLAPIRTQMVQDLAQEGRTANLRKLAKEERPKCPRCGRRVASNGKGKRRIRTAYDEVIELERHQAYCQSCRLTFFPSG